MFAPASSFVSRVLCAGLCWFLLVVAATPPSSAQTPAGHPRLTLEDIHASSLFDGASFQGGEWAARGPVITYIENDRAQRITHLMSFNLETQASERLIDGYDVLADDVGRRIAIEGYSFSEDGKAALLFTDSEPVWRANTKGFYYLFDVESRTMKPLSRRDLGFQMFAKFSPDGRYAAFVRDRNLFVVNLETMEERALTTDGAEGSIINGTSDWVYEEEFALRDGFSWSPDSRHIAFFQFDESSTRDFFMTDLREQYPRMEQFRYPKAGEANSEVRVGVADVRSGETIFFDTDTWRAGGEDHEYIPRMGWTPPIGGVNLVWMFRLNRDQSRLDLLYGDPADGLVRNAYTETETTWIEVGQRKLWYLDDNEHFLWLSESDGYRHIYLHRNGGLRIGAVTQGNWEVSSLAGVDEAAGLVYFTGTLASPLERQLYATDYRQVLNRATPATLPRKITRRAGTHAVNLSSDRRYFIDTYSSATTPPVVSLHTIDGELVRVLEGNQALIDRLAAYDLPAPEFMTVPGADGMPLNAYMIKPSKFDPNADYPMLMYVYGGPGSQTVVDSWGGSRYLWHTYLADELNMIVVSVDNRGTGGRGKAFKSGTYRQLGLLESADQIAAARSLGSLPYIDENRIGIWGWSYGGYMTLMSMLAGNGPQVFSFGAAVAPVTDWRLYDTIYTERFMSTPANNRDGYVVGAPVNYASRLEPHQRLLLVHGDFDDNVHFQNAAQMADALQAANKQFEFMMYPGRNHGIFGGKTRLHLHTMMTDFIRESLQQPVVGSVEETR
ncbi:MAG: S9 family peptidase [Rhodothermales bacterium]